MLERNPCPILCVLQHLRVVYSNALDRVVEVGIRLSHEDQVFWELHLVPTKTFIPDGCLCPTGCGIGSRANDLMQTKILTI